MTNKTKRVNVQSVFNKVIEAGLYRGVHEDSRDYMCNSLNAAKRNDIITIAEYIAACIAIKKYLCGNFTIAEIVKAHAPKTYKKHKRDFTQLYQNWYKRPKINWDLK